MKNILVVLGVLAVVAVIGAASYERFFKPPVVNPAADPATGRAATANIELKPDDMIMGPAEAKVTIVEYASLTCPHCAAFHAQTLPMVKEQYIDKGLVRLVYRDFPLDGLALRAAFLPHCAGPMRYYGLLGTLFARQAQWAANPEPLVALSLIASQAGMDGEAFKACIADKTVEKKVLDSALEAEQTYGVKSTPTLFVNGVKYVGGLTPEQMKAVLDPLVK